VRWPRRVRPGTICRQLVSSVDIAPTILTLAGIDIPSSFQGHNFLPLLKNPKVKIRDYIFAEDHWHDYEDLGRAVRSKQYKYIRNDYPDLPATPPADVGRSQTFRAMQRLLAQGKLNQNQMGCFVKPRPAEELYDIKNDPHELHNLSDNPEHVQVLREFRQALSDWSQRTNYRIPATRTPDEFDRETGEPLPNRIRPRPSKKRFSKNDAIVVLIDYRHHKVKRRNHYENSNLYRIGVDFGVVLRFVDIRKTDDPRKSSTSNIANRENRRFHRKRQRRHTRLGKD
jgi:hypothetical protein